MEVIIDLFNISYTILFTVAALPLHHRIRNTLYNNPEKLYRGIFLYPHGDVRCLIGKGEDSPPLCWAGLLFYDDLISFEGASVKELKKTFKEAFEDYIETCKQLGKEPNKTYKGTFNVRVGADTHRNAAMYAAMHNISLNDFVKTAIDFALINKEGINKFLHHR